MDIPEPDYNLDVNGLTHGAMTGQMMEKLDPIIAEEKPSASSQNKKDCCR